MRFCDQCNNPVFGTDKNTKIGYCRNHQHLRTDTDKRSILQKAVDKQNQNKINKDESITNLINDLDAIFSKYIRLRYADKNGFVDCVTCDWRGHYTKAQCGHYIPRGNMATRYEPFNSHSQCVRCNQYKDGNEAKHKEYIEKNYNKGTIEYLNELKHTPTKLSVSDLNQLIIEYRSKLKLVEAKLI